MHHQHQHGRQLGTKPLRVWAKVTAADESWSVSWGSSYTGPVLQGVTGFWWCLVNCRVFSPPDATVLWEVSPVNSRMSWYSNTCHVVLVRERWRRLFFWLLVLPVSILCSVEVDSGPRWCGRTAALPPEKLSEHQQTLKASPVITRPPWRLAECFSPGLHRWHNSAAALSFCESVADVGQSPSRCHFLEQFGEKHRR